MNRKSRREPIQCPCQVHSIGPHSHRAVKHLSTCVHSTLRETTKRRKPRRIRPVPGTRRLVAIDLPDEPKRRKR